MLNTLKNVVYEIKTNKRKLFTKLVFGFVFGIIFLIIIGRIK